MIKSIKFVIAICVVCCLCIITTNSANILVIIPTPSYSHQVPCHIIWSTLSQRGHKVVLVTTNPINDPNLTNLTEIDMQSLYSIFQKIKFYNNEEAQTWLNGLHKHIWSATNEVVTRIYEFPQIRKLYAPDSNEKFDVVIAETLFTPGIYAFAHRFNAPLIGILSLGFPTHSLYLHGAPVMPSHPSSWEMENNVLNLSFWKRSKNFVRLWYYIYYIFKYLYADQQAIAEKYLGKDIPLLSEMEKNISILFSNEDSVINYIKPQLPKIIPFSGFHISKEPEPLSEELERFLTFVPNGFIYVSLGSNVNMSSFHSELEIFRNVFASLPCKVLWKMNIELPNKPDNVYIAKWFPQQSVLAHPKIRLFIYQGGHQSTEEAVHYAVPLLGIPVFGDQFGQVIKMESLGVAKYLESSDISTKTLTDSITDMLNDKRYKERMLNLRKVVKDKPHDHLKNVIWWIEFVIRHKGAPHLRSEFADYPWYQRYDIDIIVFLSIAAFVVLLFAMIITYKIIKFTFQYYKIISINKKEKIN